MGNILNLMQILGMVKTNPQGAVLATLQQMLNSGMVSQQQYENARQNAGMFNVKGV